MHMNKKRKYKKSPIMRMCVVAFSCYIVFVMIGLQVEISNRREELETIKNKTEIQRIANKETERLLTMGQDDEYVERIARERLGFTYPDERVLIDISGS